jgi:hypothetical protein
LGGAMEVESLVMMLSRLGLGALATFLAIILWSRTRDIAWMFIVIGTIVNYGQIIYSTLETIGVVTPEAYQVFGISLPSLLLTNLPLVFYIIAFITMISRGRIR